ncbi:MAG: TAT-variant-translocated molybdopterin oxidoreductase, partial [Cyclobacteriaceae bacterium]|nr:TAT-variant-translocated molybdopterin oxidoreductase [Cyclobacteriaceae bacterium]
MKEIKKTYWKGLEQLTNDPEFVKYADKEFAEYLPVKGDKGYEDGTSRRDFLKLMGFSVAAVTVAACEAPVRKAIPYLNKPEDLDPGVPNFYASTYMQGGDFCSILVKTREGRPIKIEGNNLSPVTKGGTSAIVEGSVLSLYDDSRLRNPQKDGADTDWVTIDKEIKAGLASGQIRIVTQTILSPSTKKVLNDFTAKYPNTKVVQYDTQSVSGIIQANKTSFGKSVLPSYDFSKAEVIVAFDADFLGTWVSPIEYTKQYSQTRKLGSGKTTMSRHYQFESNLSVTGANADYRTAIKPSQQGPAVVALYNALAKRAGTSPISGGGVVDNVDKAAEDLWNAKGKSLVVSGTNDTAVQVVVNAINNLLGNYGKTIDLDNYSANRSGDDSQMEAFVKELASGSVKSVIFLDCNPVYNHPKGKQIAENIGKAALSVSTADRYDETSSLVKIVATGNHYLESWGDAEPKPGLLTLIQPAITKIFNSRQAEESLLSWSGNASDYYTYVSNRWMQNYYSNQSKFVDFQQFFDSCLHDGIYTNKVEGAQVEILNAPIAEDIDSSAESNVSSTGFNGDLAGAATKIATTYKTGDGFELALYFNVGIGDGRDANNPWLQEMPDPITKATWDNYLTLSQSDAAEIGISMFEGKCNMANLTIGDQTLEVPVLVQPGQAKGTVGLALGYGRTVSGKVGDGKGINAYPFASIINGAVSYNVISGISIQKSENIYQVAQTQTHETFMNREFVIQESVLGEYQKNPSAGRYAPSISTWKSETGSVAPGMLSLWKGHEYPDHHWGLAIDLNSCTGCSTCTIACQAENNIPVVGRDEVIMRREMHWMRIDRYYS